MPKSKYILNVPATFSAILATSLFTTLSHASDGLTGPLPCPEFKVTARIMSISRLDAGKLSLVVEYETAANVPLLLGTQGQQMSLVDDSGNQWEWTRSNALMQAGGIESGVKKKVNYQFTNILEGASASKASILHRINVRAGNKTLGRCTFTARDLPIS